MITDYVYKTLCSTIIGLNKFKDFQVNSVQQPVTLDILCQLMR